MRVGRKHPRFFRAFLWMKLPLWTILGALLWVKPEQTFLIFLLPGFLTLFHTIWVTYEHHAGLPTTDHFDASRNRDNRFFNILTGNLGLHTAHHRRPGLHWSLLRSSTSRSATAFPKTRSPRASGTSGGSSRARGLGLRSRRTSPHQPWRYIQPYG